MAKPRIYAEDTKVPVGQSIDEIDRLVTRFGCSGFQYADAKSMIAIMFAGDDRRVRFVLEFGDRPDGGTALTGWERKRRALTRALVLVIKAKLVSVEAGVETFEESFLPQTVMPDGNTVMQHVGQKIITAYREGTPGNLLPDFSGGKG